MTKNNSLREYTLRVAARALLILLVFGGGASALSNNGGGSWEYYHDITINNFGSALSDYQVRVNLTGDAYPKGANTSGEDIRFTNADGAELAYWIEKWNFANRSGLVWVNMNSVPAGISMIRMWSGNPSARSSSNPINTFMINSIYAMEGSCSNITNCGYMDNHNEAKSVRTYPANIGTKYVSKIYWGSVWDNSSPDSRVKDNFYSRFRFLFLPDVSGIWKFSVDSDDGSELILNPGDYDNPFNETNISNWYGAHAWCNCTKHNGTKNLNVNQGMWMDYLQEEWNGQEAAVVRIQRPGGNWLILDSANFPGQILARKYASPEPSVSVGNESFNQPPVALFTSSTCELYKPCNPFFVTLNASSSFDPDGYDGYITEYSWDFGDGSKGKGKVTSHLYSSQNKDDRLYVITLTVTDTGEKKSSLSKPWDPYSETG